MVTVEEVRARLASVMDPEIPSCSVIDLGIVERIHLEGDAVEIDLLPTFSGCPALDVIREDVESAARALTPHVTVRWIRTKAWTTDRITAEGRARLTEYGIAPPGERMLLQLGKPRPIACPYCGSLDTHEDAAFGPTPCRAIRYCPSCKNPFEAFKPKATEPATHG